MTTTEYADFTRAICSAPDDDTPRLVFADWLEENGEVERAEFIRVQCEFATLNQTDRTCPFIKEYSRPDPGPEPVERWREGICKCRGCVLVRREMAIRDLRHPERSNEYLLNSWFFDGRLHTYGSGDRRLLWYPPAPDGHSAYLVDIERGFVKSILCSAEVWFRHADQVSWNPEYNAVKKPVSSYYSDKSSPRRRYHTPCPPTAQPIREVSLTTDFDWFAGLKNELYLTTNPRSTSLTNGNRKCNLVQYGDWWGTAGKTIPQFILEREWPWLTFRFGGEALVAGR